MWCNVILLSCLLFIQFVAHPNVQQLLASIWYEGKRVLYLHLHDTLLTFNNFLQCESFFFSLGLPGFRRKNIGLQALEIIRIGKATNR